MFNLNKLICVAVFWSFVNLFVTLLYFTSSSWQQFRFPQPLVNPERVELIPSQDDPWLIQFVRQKYIQTPFSLEYNLTTATTNPDPSEGQVDAVKGLLQNIKTGFFIECGANDGEFISNTLWFEKVLGWNGLLIEADPNTFRRMRTKNRKAWHANVCLSPTVFPQKLTFYSAADGDGGRNGFKNRDSVNQSSIVECIPLYTLLAAIDQTVVDVFSLDIEGAEFDVLKTIPFDKISFKVFIIEHWGLDRKNLKMFMNSKGFKLFHVINTLYSQDSIYVLDSLLPSNFTELTT